MKSLDLGAYESLRADGRVIEADRFGEKVVLLPDGTYLKLFRRKRLLSSALFRPYASRFAENCSRLKVLGIPCPEVIDLFRVKDIARDVVHYRPLVGRTIRSLVASGLTWDDATILRADLGRLVAQLHSKGIYFRSLHLGNIVISDSGTLGLIDVADMTFGKGPLGASRATRNLRHLMRYRDDAKWLLSDDRFSSALKCAS